MSYLLCRSGAADCLSLQNPALLSASRSVPTARHAGLRQDYPSCLQALDYFMVNIQTIKPRFLNETLHVTLQTSTEVQTLSNPERLH